MRRRVALLVLLLLSVSLTLHHVRVERQDHGWLLNVYESPLDVRGWALDLWAASSMRCRSMQPPEPSVQADLLEQVRLFSLPDSSPVVPLQWRQQGDWALLEVTFERLSPAVVLLQRQHHRWRVVPTGIWSGTTYPWRPSPLIRHYLRTRNPDVPDGLLNCWQAQPGIFR